MDNSYYTGATLVRGLNQGALYPLQHTGHIHGQTHGHISGHIPGHIQVTGHPPNYGHGQFYAAQHSGATASTSLAGLPLLMQPRHNGGGSNNSKKQLFSGAPLIQIGPPPATPPAPPQTVANQNGPPPPSGLMIGFQPFYYVSTMQQQQPSTPPFQAQHLATAQQAAILNSGQAPISNSNSNQMAPKKSPGAGGQLTKRRNYKSLQIPVPVSQQQNLNSSVSFPAVSVSGSGSGTGTVLGLKLAGNLPNFDKSEPLIQDSEAFLESKSPNILPNPIAKCKLSPKNSFDHNNNNNNNHNISSSPPFNNLNFPPMSNKSNRYPITYSKDQGQRSDKLLNFYFYDEHWLPKNVDTKTAEEPEIVQIGHFDPQNIIDDADSNGGSPCDQGGLDHNFTDYNNNCLSYSNDLQGMFGIGPPSSGSQLFGHNSTTTNHGQGHGGHLLSHYSKQPTLQISALKTNFGDGSVNCDSGATASKSEIIIKKKDLEVDAQIITLANGHRDLEIRLCYVTS